MAPALTNRNPYPNQTAAHPSAARARHHSPKRCAIVLPSAGMLAKFGQTLILEASQQGHQIFCFAPDWNEKSAHYASALGAEPHTVASLGKPASPLTSEQSIRKLRAAFKQIEPHAVLGMSFDAATVSALAAQMAGVPHVVSMLLDGSDDIAIMTQDVSWARRQFVKPLWWATLRASHAMILPCARDAQTLAASGQLPSGIEIICTGLPGIDIRQIPHLPLPPLENGVIFLMAADLDEREGILDYCEAAEIMRSRARTARCLLAGKPAASRTAFPLDALKRYRSAVHYLGPRDDVVQLIAKSHALVVPSHGTGRSDMLIVALALGRPVIATSTRGLTETVENGVNGMIVPPGDAVALARAMVQFLQRPDLIPRMADASRTLAEQRFDIRLVTQAVLKALKL